MNSPRDMREPTFSGPKAFTDRFPHYVYRDGKGKETVQWRQAALDMANVNAELLEALESLLPMADAHAKRLHTQHQSTEFAAGASNALAKVESARLAIAKARGQA